MRSEPPWVQLDDGIRPIVRLLWEAGLEPMASCEGGTGHVFYLPTVQLKADSREHATEVRDQALFVLIGAGYVGMSASAVWDVQDRLQPWRTWVQIEFWQGRKDRPEADDLLRHSVERTIAEAIVSERRRLQELVEQELSGVRYRADGSLRPDHLSASLALQNVLRICFGKT